MAATELPMILYNIPQFTGVESTITSAAELLADPQVVGVKHTADSMYALERIRSAFPDKVLLNGFDETYLSACMAGANGAIGTTIGLQPMRFQRIRGYVAAGDLVAAQRVQSEINAVIEELVAVSVFPAAKYLSGSPPGSLGPCRSPFARLDDEARRRLDALARTQLRANTDAEFA